MISWRYLRQSWRCRRQWGESAPAWPELRRWQRSWRESRRPGRNSLADEAPWITFGAREYLDRHVTSMSHIFEWGSGGSSLYFARRAAAVISVEHDPAWFAAVSAAIQQKGLTNWQGRLAAPEPASSADTLDAASSTSYASDDIQFRGLLFRNYVRQIEAVPDASQDVIVIDGRARPSCLPPALAKLKPGGCLVWDNSEREYYFPAMQLIPAAYLRRDFPGPGPYVAGFWRTTIWEAPQAQPAGDELSARKAVA